MIIIDEAHERKIQIDFLLYLLRETLAKRPEFKLIIMSATIDAKIFTNYFSSFKFKEINIGGKTNFPIDSIFLETAISPRNFVDKGIEVILEIMEKDKNGDILFFVTSANETFDVCKKLTPLLEKNKSKYKIEDCKNGIYCIEVFAGMNPKNQLLAQDRNEYKTLGDYCRKIVISTNVAESSLTIDGIKYVVDSGLEFKSFYDPLLRARRLDRQYISHAQAKQRMGRAGRTEPGICYHLYTRDTFDTEMDRFPKSDIKTSNLTNESLRFLNLDVIDTIDDLRKVYDNLIESPDEQYIKSAITNLEQLGLIEGNKLNNLGKLVAELGQDVNVSLSLIYGYSLMCKNELIIIFSMLDVGKSNMSSFFIDPKYLLKGRESDSKYNKMLKKLTEKYKDKTKKFISSTGDHITLLKIYEAYKKKLDQNSKNIVTWGNDHFLKIKPIEKAYRYAKSTNRNVRRILGEYDYTKLDLNFSDEIKTKSLMDRILVSLALGFRNNTAVINSDKRTYSTQITSDIDIKISKSSVLKNKKEKDIFFNELFISMGMADLNIISKISPKLKKLM
jgi:pre-mRNA-splicing factor ATP-dependent RNA helicase DHX15/PRP43